MAVTRRLTLRATFLRPLVYNPQAIREHRAPLLTNLGQSMNISQFPKYLAGDPSADSPAKTAFKLVSRSDYVNSMSRVANSVNVVTTDGPRGRAGVTVSAATSVTAEPPTLLVCIHEASEATAAILGNGVFCLNVLEAGQQAFSELFAGLRPDAPADKFEAGHWTHLVTGAPVLEEGLAVFDCRVDAVLKEGTHQIFVGQVVATRTGKGLPLVYSHRAYARPDWGGGIIPD